MKTKIDTIFKELKEFQPKNKHELEAFRLKYLTKKGVIPALFNAFKSIPNEEKRELGKSLNVLKNTAQDVFQKFKEELSHQHDNSKKDIDLSLPSGFRNWEADILSLC